MKYKILILFAFSVLISSCKKDFDVTEDWKDITIVYSLLDQNDAVHYIKISKAYLGEGNVMVMAQNYDSCNYALPLDVCIEEWRNGSYYTTFNLDTTTVYTKESGDFYSPKQILYKFSNALNENSEYKLIIKNTQTGKIITSETGMVNDFTIEKPYYNPYIPTIGFIGTSSEVKWISAKNGRAYDVTFRFHYSEKNIYTSDTTEHTVDWSIGGCTSSDIDGGEALTQTYSSEQFFANLQSSIPVNYDVVRTAGQVDLIIAVAGDEFNTYMDVYKPSNTIVEEKPSYTNINNGIGLFSCRYSITRSYWLNTRSLDSLMNGSYTGNLF